MKTAASKWSKDLRKKAEVEHLYVKGIRPSDIARTTGIPYLQVKYIVYHDKYLARVWKYFLSGNRYKKILLANKLRNRRTARAKLLSSKKKLKTKV